MAPSRRRRRVFASCFLAAALGASGLTSLGPTDTAHADPACVNGGIYMVFARGSGEHLNDLRAHQFYWSMQEAIHAANPSMPIAWSELGNEDGDIGVNMADDPAYRGQPKPQQNDSNEYPATGSLGAAISTIYSGSVTKGSNELVTHLDDRVARCPGESIVLGGYSQGADVVGWTLQRSELNPTVLNHIGFVALYGDPKFDPGPLADRQNNVNFDKDWWWVRGRGDGYHWASYGFKSDTGYYGTRDTYVFDKFKGRFGSWCAIDDGICTGMF
jgi:hypothetical protein